MSRYKPSRCFCPECHHRLGYEPCDTAEYNWGWLKEPATFFICKSCGGMFDRHHTLSNSGLVYRDYQDPHEFYDDCDCTLDDYPFQPWPVT